MHQRNDITWREKNHRILTNRRVCESPPSSLSESLQIRVHATPSSHPKKNRRSRLIVSLTSFFRKRLVKLVQTYARISQTSRRSAENWHETVDSERRGTLAVLSLVSNRWIRFVRFISHGGRKRERERERENTKKKEPKWRANHTRIVQYARSIYWRVLNCSLITLLLLSTDTTDSLSDDLPLQPRLSLLPCSILFFFFLSSPVPFSTNSSQAMYSCVLRCRRSRDHQVS